MTIVFAPQGEEANRAAQIIAALAAAGVTLLTLSYEGENDQGGDTDVEAKDASDRVVDISALPTLFREDPAWFSTSLVGDCEELLDIALGHHCPGWEINDGSKGEFTIVVATGEMLLTNEFKNEFGEDEEGEDEADLESEDA